MSVAIGASATGARAYTATASQGLLYMAEALYNASGLGLPIVMTVANRAIGAPINIWNDHSDAMSQRDCGWIQLYAQDNQEAARPAPPGVPAGRGGVAAGDGVHGRLHPHARHRAAGAPGQRAGGRVPAAVRAAPGARPGGPGLDRRDGRPRGVHRGALPGARPAGAGAGADPAGRGGVRRRVRPGLRRAGPPVPHRRTRRRSSSRSARCSARSRTPSTSCAPGECRIGALGITSFRPFPLDAVRAALGGTQRVVVLEKALAVGIGGIVSANVRMAMARDRGSTATRSSPASAAGRSPRPRCGTCCTGRSADELEPLTFLDLNTELVERELDRAAAARRSGPAAENMLRDLGAVASRIG